MKWTIAAVLGAGMVAPLSGASACEPKQIETVQHALTHASDGQLVTIALAGLAEACPSPAPLAKVALELAFAPPEQRPQLVARAITQVPALWARACKGGLRTFEALAVVAPTGRATLLHKRCDGARLGFSVDDLARKNGHPLLALLYAQLLDETKVGEAPKRTIKAALVGRRP